MGSSSKKTDYFSWIVLIDSNLLIFLNLKLIYSQIFFTFQKRKLNSYRLPKENLKVIDNNEICFHINFIKWSRTASILEEKRQRTLMQVKFNL